MPRKVESTSFRSATQATDSTCRGCKANKAATMPLRHTDPVIRRSASSSTIELPACNARFTRCMARLERPKSCTSSISDHHVSGCQLACHSVVSAQVTESQLSPSRRCGFSYTYSRSSNTMKSADPTAQ